MAELPDKSQSFIDWYLAVVEAADLSDKRYPVKGMNVWTPYGFAARRALDAVIVRALEASGSRAVEFPALIPQNEFEKESEHIKGFDAQVYWVTKGGATTLDMPLVLRPTSETAMYPVFALWVRSHRDLPLNVYQVVNTFRYETKTTRPFLRVREIHFIEEHTCQLDEKTASARVGANLASFEEMARAFAIPYLALRRPDWDKFPGAYYSVAFDIPIGGARTLQVGTTHHYRENFAQPYGIQYEAADGSRRYVSQTTFGLSERLIGAVLAVHGDAKGAIFPSALAPFQVVVVPILGGDGGRTAVGFAQEVATALRGAGLRVHLDDGDDRPGAKYYRWELKGVPLRLEIGPREAAARTVTVVSRLGGKSVASSDRLIDSIQDALTQYDRALSERADASFRAAFALATKIDELVGSKNVRYFGWCGKEECGHAVEKAIDGALLGIPEGAFPLAAGAPGPCLVCGSTVSTRWAVAGQPV